ncbi:MAG TPA: efflux RND transporter periplasmic adaptor subunit [Kofleriaceae bacterium]|jgi:RND family efflux transporter MFP subunit|nr:efflux RND transporter periplasmic adaptor subunit [Kofleriaceae bacterium]
MLTRISYLVLAAAAAIAGCNKETDGQHALPPATGPGSPPLPVLPQLAKQARNVGSAGSAVASVRRSTGTLLPHAEVAVVARASGVVVAMAVDVGARVKKGQVLFRVDEQAAALRLAQAQTQLAAAEQQRRSTDVEYQRTKRLFDQQAASPQQWDQISAQLEAAKVGVAQAQNGVALAQKAVADATARAPIEGIVVSRRVALGDYVSDVPPTQVLVLQDQATLDLKFRLPERALASVSPGDALAVSLPALGISRKANVSVIAPSVDARTRTIELTAVLDNRDGALRPGLMADVELDEASITASSPTP